MAVCAVYGTSKIFVNFNWPTRFLNVPCASKKYRITVWNTLLVCSAVVDTPDASIVYALMPKKDDVSLRIVVLALVLHTLHPRIDSA